MIAIWLTVSLDAFIENFSSSADSMELEFSSTAIGID
jgi:hypothetical protein